MDLTYEKMGFDITSKDFDCGSLFTTGHVVTLPILFKNKEKLKVAILESKEGYFLTDGGALDSLAKSLGLTSPEFVKRRNEMAKKHFCEFKVLNKVKDLQLLYRPVNNEISVAFPYFLGVIMQFLTWTEIQRIVEEFGKSRGLSDTQISEAFRRLVPSKGSSGHA